MRWRYLSSKRNPPVAYQSIRKFSTRLNTKLRSKPFKKRRKEAVRRTPSCMLCLGQRHGEEPDQRRGGRIRAFKAQTSKRQVRSLTRPTLLGGETKRSGSLRQRRNAMSRCHSPVCRSRRGRPKRFFDRHRRLWWRRIWRFRSRRFAPTPRPRRSRLSSVPVLPLNTPNLDRRPMKGRPPHLALEKTNDGFRVAESDLQLRGAGDLWGSKQSGNSVELFHASLATDLYLPKKRRESRQVELAAK